MEHTIDRFLAFNPDIKVIITLPKDWMEYAEKLLQGYSNISLIEGGKERFHSIKNALSSLDDLDEIAVHDAVRPLVSNHCIQNCFSALESANAVIPVIGISESMRKIEGGNSKHLNRAEFRLVQTPQCFQFDILKRAYEQAYDSGFTDDASVVEKMGIPIKLVEGNKENIKLTHPTDLKIAEVLL